MYESVIYKLGWRINRMSHGRQRTALDRSAFRAAVIPQDDLSGIGASQYEVGMEAGKTAGQHWRLAMEDVLGRRLLEARVPDEANSVGIVRRVLQI